jgi:hypothetical protein
MVCLSKVVNLLISTGHDSLKRLTSEIKRAPNMKITKKVRIKEIVIAKILLNLIRTKKFTTGCNTIAKINAKAIGISIPLAMYNIAIKAKKPIRNIVVFR